MSAPTASPEKSDTAASGGPPTVGVAGGGGGDCKGGGGGGGSGSGEGGGEGDGGGGGGGMRGMLARSGGCGGGEGHASQVTGQSSSAFASHAASAHEPMATQAPVESRHEVVKSGQS